MPRVNKIKRDKAISALRKAGMDPSTAASLWKLLDLSAPLADQITALAEEDPELFGLDADGNPLDDTSEEDTRPMTAREAQRARLSGRHRLTPSRATGTTPSERNAAALGALRERSAHTTTASATAQAAAARLRAGVGNGADRG